MGKFTSYAALAAAQVDDLLLVVDVHDTTMDASGTTKKITAGSLLNVTLAAPPTGNATTDTANINTAITAWIAAGRGILQLQEGL